MAAATRGNEPARRRDNAPIRRRRPATTVPDLLFAIGAAAWGMGAVFAAATFINKDLTAGDAGAALARIFAVTLAIMGAFVFGLGFLLLRDERAQADHFRVPVILGLLVGLAEATLFLHPAGALVYVPPLFLLFALRPFRRLVANIVGQGGR